MSMGQFISDPYVLWAVICLAVLTYDLVRCLKPDQRREAPDELADHNG
jgi:hypothetical protein